MSCCYPSTTRVNKTTLRHNPHPQRNRVVLLVEVASGAAVAGIGAVAGLFGLPAWAVVLLAVDFTAFVMFWTHAAIGPTEERVRSLWGASFVLLALLVGVLIYVNWPIASSVYYVPDKDVTLSGVAGEPPRTEYNAPALSSEDEYLADCYVVVHGQVWLAFRAGWAQASELHLAPDAHSALPAQC